MVQWDAETEVTALDEALWNRLTLEASDGVFPLSTDTMLLSDFVRLRPRARVADLGCGCGALGLLLCARSTDCTVTGIELLPRACAQARANIAASGLSERMRVVPGDLQAIRTLLPAGSYTDAAANPPYFPAASPAAPEPGRAAARSQAFCPPEALCAAAAWLLQWGGRFSLVFRPESLCDFLCALRSARLEPKRLRPVRPRPGGPVRLLLLEAVLGGRPGLRWEPDLLLEEADGRPTADARRIYHLEGDA